MKSKDKSIILIVILSAVAILITSLLVFMLAIKPDMNYISIFMSNKNIPVTEREYSLEGLEKIVVNTNSFDIEFAENTEDNIKLKIIGDKDNNIKTQEKDNTLTINEKTKIKVRIGLFFGVNEKIVIYIPKNAELNVSAKTDSGDIKTADFSNINFKYKTDSGDIAVKAANRLEADTDSGDITIKSVKAANCSSDSGDIIIQSVTTLTAETDSGDVIIADFKINGNSSISTDSGDVLIKSITDCYIETKTDSGYLKVKESNRFSEFVLKIKTDSGDVLIK